MARLALPDCSGDAYSQLRAESIDRFRSGSARSCDRMDADDRSRNCTRPVAALSRMVDGSIALCTTPLRCIRCSSKAIASVARMAAWILPTLGDCTGGKDRSPGPPVRCARRRAAGGGLIVDALIPCADGGRDVSSDRDDDDDDDDDDDWLGESRDADDKAGEVLPEGGSTDCSSSSPPRSGSTSATQGCVRRCGRRSSQHAQEGEAGAVAAAVVAAANGEEGACLSATAAAAKGEGSPCPWLGACSKGRSLSWITDSYRSFGVML